MSRVLIDTNILVYIEDPRDRARQAASRSVVADLVSRGEAVLIVQCLNEFYRAVRWKLSPPLIAQDAIIQAERLGRNCTILPLTVDVAMDGMRACEQYSMSFWDALIWAVAKENGIPYLLTEDFEDGANVEGVQFVNPFAATFDVRTSLT